MARTPDSFPGQRTEEDILFYVTASLPSQSGQVLYASGTALGSGFFFNEAGSVRGLGISEAQHDRQFTLAHDVVSSSYDQVSYDNNNRLTQYVVWADSSVTRKVQQYDVQYTGSSSLIVALTASQYDATGSLSYRVLEVPAYNSRNRIVALTRVRTG